MNCLNYLKREEIEDERLKLLAKDFSLLYSWDGEKCPVCGIVQGKPNKKLGIRKYYCDHVYNRVNRKMKKEKEKIFRRVLRFQLNFMELNKKKN